MTTRVIVSTARGRRRIEEALQLSLVRSPNPIAGDGAPTSGGTHDDGPAAGTATERSHSESWGAM